MASAVATASSASSGRRVAANTSATSRSCCASRSSVARPHARLIASRRATSVGSAKAPTTTTGSPRSRFATWSPTMSISCLLGSSGLISGSVCNASERSTRAAASGTGESTFAGCATSPSGFAIIASTRWSVAESVLPARACASIAAWMRAATYASGTGTIRTFSSRRTRSNSSRTFVRELSSASTSWIPSGSASTRVHAMAPERSTRVWMRNCTAVAVGEDTYEGSPANASRCASDVTAAPR